MVWDFGFVHQVLSYSRYDNGGMMSRVRQFRHGSFLRLSMLLAHGKDYLAREEYRYYLKRAEREYFMQLTRSACALRREPREFWEFHRKGLASINYSFDWKRLARRLPRAVIEKTWWAFWKVWDNDFIPNPANGRAIHESRTTGCEEKAVTIR
jgi:hypothetical protein